MYGTGRSQENRHAGEQQAISRWTLFDGALAVLVGAVSMILYARTLHPHLLPGDSGEFQVLARLLGNTHPTGYQVYVVLGHLFTWLPVRDVAYRVNLFSAAMGALAIIEVYLAGRLLTGRRWPALFAAGVLGLSATFWSQAVIAEVYTCGAAFLAGVLLALIYWDRSGHGWALWIAGLLGGLSIGVHLTVALSAPAVGLYLVLKRKEGAKMWRAALLGALVGLVLAVGTFFALDGRDSPADFIDIAILPSRSVWGLDEADLDTSIERLAFSLGGRQWRDRMFSDPARVMPEQIAWYVSNLPNEFSWIALVLALVGGVALCRRRSRLAVLLLGSLLAAWLYAFNYEIHDVYVFHISSYLLLALLVASGGGSLADWAASSWRRKGLGRALTAIAVLALCGLGLVPMLAPRWEAVRDGRVPDFSFSGYPVDERSIIEQLDIQMAIQKLPRDALVFLNWRHLYPFYYLAHIEGARADLVFLEEKPYRAGPQQESSMLQYVQEHIPDHAVYFSQCLDELTRAGYRCRLVPTRTIRLYRILPAE